MKYFMLLIFLPYSLVACANQDINCSNAVNTQQMRICAEENLNQLNTEVKELESKIMLALIDYSGEEHSNQFITLQKKWTNFVELQCINVRGLYGRGSLAGVSYINCKNKYLRDRVKDLSLTYNEVIADK